jgi:hypothetical protein
VVNDDKLDEQTKVNMFHQSFRKLTEITIRLVANTVSSVEVDGQTVTDPKFIAEFIEKADKNFYTSIVDHVTSNRNRFAIKPLRVLSTEEDIKAGAPKEFEVPVTFDQSNFFA